MCLPILPGLMTPFCGRTHAKPPNFEAQCEAMLEAGPTIISSIMGLFPERFVARMKSKGIKWLATVTTVSEANPSYSAGLEFELTGVAQGVELA